MAHYTTLTQQEMLQITQRYGLDVISFQTMDGGAGNSSFLLQTSNQTLVLTVFDEKSFDEVTNLGRLLLYLEKQQFSTTRILRTCNGEISVNYANKPVLLKKYIDGDTGTQLTQNMLEATGAEMARLHGLTVPNYLPDSHSYGLQLYPTVFTQAIDPEYEAWLALKYDALKLKLNRALPVGLIHGDLFDDNVLYQGEILKAIIDFEEACFYTYVFDIGMAIIGLCVEDGEIMLSRTESFVRGYQQVRKLQQDEKLALQQYVEYAAIATSYWRYWKYNIHTPIKEKSHKHWQMTRLANAVAEMPEQVFIHGVFPEDNTTARPC